MKRGIPIVCACLLLAGCAVSPSSRAVIRQAEAQSRAVLALERIAKSLEAIQEGLKNQPPPANPLPIQPWAWPTNNMILLESRGAVLCGATNGLRQTGTR